MGKISFICFSQNNWEKRKARKQQFMLHLSKREDVEAVLYVEPPLNFFRILLFPFSESNTSEKRRRWLRAISFSMEKISDKLSLCTPLFFIPFFHRIQFIYNLNLYIYHKIIDAKIRRRGFENNVLWLYHPFDYPLLRWFDRRILSVYDWAEEWADYFIELPEKRLREIKSFEEKIISESDIVFTVSKRLFEKAKEITPDSYRLYDGTNPDMFRKKITVPEDILRIRRPIIGYTGTITERMDIKLIASISESFPEASLVFIGDIHEVRVDVSSISKKKNVHFLGGKSYEELSAYMKNFDVCILPYIAQNDISLPTKIFDYLASGKPVISTNLPEIERFEKIVRIAKTREEFIDFIKEALAEDVSELRKMRIETAEKNSWDVRAEEILKILENYRRVKKILVIPTYYVDPRKMKIRIIELAKNLSLKYRVYLLTWHTSVGGELLKRASDNIRDFFKREKKVKRGSITMVELPLLRRPLASALKFNSYFLREFIEREEIDLVLNGSFYMFDIPEERSFKYILDLADLPAETSDTYFERFIHKRTALEVKKADTITVVSQGLAEYVVKNYGREAHVLPNGAYVDNLRAVKREKVDEIRNRYMLTDRWIIGYIGLIGSWVDIEFLVDVFNEVKKEIKNVALLVVGASPRLGELRCKFTGEDIVITGNVEEDISAYFKALDLGVLPHKKSFYQDVAFHIKLIEYTASRKIVVATPLEEIKRLNFPNIITADMNVEDWLNAIKKAKEIQWSCEWDRLPESYDWRDIAGRLFRIIEGLGVISEV